jgi:hypothetical protein
MSRKQAALPLGDTPLEHGVISHINEGVHDIDMLQHLSDVDMSEFLQTITLMELKGMVRQQGGRLWTN